MEEGKFFLKQEGYKQLPVGQVKNLIKTSINYIYAVDLLCIAKRQLIVYCSFCVILTNNNSHNGCEL